VPLNESPRMIIRSTRCTIPISDGWCWRRRKPNKISLFDLAIVRELAVRRAPPACRTVAAQGFLAPPL